MSLTTTSVLADTAWWRLVVERLGRQFAQTALPLFAVITAAPGEFEPKAFAVAAVLALALSLGLSILRELVAITPSVDAALPWRLLDRAVDRGRVDGGVRPNYRFVWLLRVVSG
mgnify:CR=1 FL=1